MKHYVLTISREYGAYGHTVGAGLARDLGVKVYDKQLIETSAKMVMNLPTDVEEVDEKFNARRRFSLSRISEMTLMKDVIRAQSQIIEEAAQKRDSCIIIGRCADYILRDRDDVLNVYLCAPFDVRVKNIMESYLYNTDVQDVLKRADGKENIDEIFHNLVVEQDRQRNDYYRYVTGTDRCLRTEKSLAIDVHMLGVENTIHLIETALEMKFGEEK